MNALQNMAIAIAVVLITMACMVFGDWLARSKAQPNHYYCQNAKSPEDAEIRAPRIDALAKQKEARKTANERYHELCSQWRSAQSAEDAAHVAWLQLWMGLAGLGGLLATLIFAGQSARAASIAATAIVSAERAFVKMSHKPPGVANIDATSGVVSVVFHVQNYGRTPADVIGVNISGCIVFSGGVLPSKPDYGSNVGVRRGGTFLVEGDFYVMPREFTVPLVNVPLISSGSAILYVFGYVDYRDRMTGEIHRAGYGRRYMPAPPPPIDNLVFIEQAGYNYDRLRLLNESKDWDGAT